TNALFLRRYDPEYLEEMKGIADGASAAGAKFDGRAIDLVDIVALNSWPEIDTLDSALAATPTGLEGVRFPEDGPKALPAPKPIQYADGIDKAVEILRAGNNGLYTNEWLMADIKTNEIAMFELGTHKDRLYRSGKDDWFGGTEGFYWGCNNTKDLDVRLETIPSVKGRPAAAVFRPSDRD